MPLTAVLIPRSYDVRLFDTGHVTYGHTPWVGTARVDVNELGEANITGIARTDGGHVANIGPPVLSELRACGVKTCVWTKTTAGRKRIVRVIFPENCTEDEARRFATLRDAERASGANFISKP